MINRKNPLVDKCSVLIHVSLIQRSQMQQANWLGVRLDVHNVFMWDKASCVERFLGAERAQRAMALRSMIGILGMEVVSGRRIFR